MGIGAGAGGGTPLVADLMVFMLVPFEGRAGTGGVSGVVGSWAAEMVR